MAGGKNSSGVLGSSELYNPVNQAFTASGTMVTQRWMHSATFLNDGTVLIAGGSNTTTGTTLDTAEIYNPSTGAFTLLSDTLNTARAGHTATLLNNGQVLLVGGIDPTAGIISDCEIYDPPTQSFIDLGDSNDPRYRHTATLLQNGQVLIAGGETDPAPTGAFNTAELFDPVAQTFTALAVPMTSGREGHVATLLNNGQVLIAGGDNSGTNSLNTAEVFNPTLGVFTPVAATMTAPRFSATVNLLNGGTVLIAGGATDSGGSSTVLSSAEVFNPTSQTFASAAGSMTSAREHQTASLLNDGTVFIAGGTNGTGILNSAELYTASQLSGLVSIAVAPATPSIGVGAQQSFTATGTFSNGSTQQLASVRWSSSSTTVAPVSGDSTNAGTAPATAQGTTTITASAPGVSGTATLTVTAPTLTSFAVSPQNTAIPLATTQQFAATGTYTDGSTQDLTASTTWTSSATAVAPITSGGLATGQALGSASIQASYGTSSASTGVTVSGPALVSVSISPATATIASGASQQYHATGTYSDSSTQDVTSLVAWSSGTTTVATVTTAGLVTAAAQGTSTITAASGSVTVSGSLTVGAPTLATVAIAPNVAVISSTGTQQLTATGTYTDRSTQNLTASSTWASSNTAVVTVSSSGLATAVAAGTATITATNGSTAGTASLVVSSGTTQTSLITSRYQHSATIMNNGQILLVGGVTCPTSSSCSYLSSAEIYNPASDTFASTGAMATARSAPAVLLNSGKVLVAGGYSCNSSGTCSSLNSAEIYDPNAGTFSGAGTMTQSRTGHTMTILANGTILIAGGETCTSATSCTAQSSAEIYDPVAGTFTATANNMSAARFGASAVELTSGLVVIAGGFDGSNLPAAAELYNPVSGLFEGIGASLNVPRFAATATLLNDGQVLVAGGSTCALPGCPTNAAEIYDPVGNTFTAVTGGMTAARFDHTATLTTNGQVYIAGGFSSCSSSCTSVASTEAFDPVAVTFSAATSVAYALAGQTATLVGNGNVLLVGGINAGVTLAGDAWYQPANLTPPGLISIAVTPASLELTPGQSQQFVATGTLNDGSTVTLQSVVWSSSATAVAPISNSAGSQGAATALAAGTTALTATAGGVSGSASLSVATLVSLAISSASTTIYIGAPQQFSAKGTLTDGTVLDLTALSAWTVSNTSVLASGGAPGSAFGIATGTSSFTAMYGGVSANSSITVQTAPPPGSPSISSISPSSGSAGTAVTISGSGFGAAQNNGQVWLGSTIGIVVSWSNTLIQAAVASNAMTGNIQVQQGGVWSNSVAFTVNTATVSGVSPSIGVPGTQIAISGANFGTTQGQVFIGNASAVVVSWGDTQVVAVVPTQSAPGPGIVQILANNVMSNAWGFTVDSLAITGVSPTSGSTGTAVTISGSGFGTSQGYSTVWIGGVELTVPSSCGGQSCWSGSAVTVQIPGGALSGPIYVVLDGVSSNGKHFSVTSGSGSTTLAPDVINMAVGDMHTIQSLNASSQPVTGLTWTSSNANVVSLSTDDPPILTAVSVGKATISAGTASAIVNVSAILPIGTVLWSNAGDGSGVSSIVPAVPSSTGVADVFAFQNDGTVQAITPDGTTAWTADVSQALFWGPQWVVPNFQSGLTVMNEHDGGGYSIVTLDGITGQPVSTYTEPTAQLDGPNFAVHTDGTIFVAQATPTGISVIGINSETGNGVFSVPMPVGGLHSVLGLIIAGDGNAYMPYEYEDLDAKIDHLVLFQIDSSGMYNAIPIWDLPTPSGVGNFFLANVITNTDQGVLVTWSANPSPTCCADTVFGMSVVSGTAATPVNPPLLPGQYEPITPVLQAQDGSFVGSTYIDGQGTTMVAFDVTGNVLWTVPNEQPEIALDDGGVIGQSGLTYDQNGNTTGRLGSLTQSWQGNSYQIGSAEQILTPLIYLAVSYAAEQSGSRSKSGTFVRPYDTPQQALDALASANLTATPRCNQLLGQLASIAGESVANLLAQIKTNATGARDFVYDGPSSNTQLTQAKFPGVASAGVTTVGQWFAEFPGAQGLSQFNGYAVWVRLSQWHGWIAHFTSPMLILGTGRVNKYGMGTMMHEVLHKQAVGGFTHDQMLAAIIAVGQPPVNFGNNAISDGIGKLCFNNLR